MSRLGVHFALSSEQADSIWDPYLEQDDEAVMAAVDAIEDTWDEEHLQETDKAWDPIHRVLSDGTLEWEGGEWPLKGAVLGGECLYFGDDYIVRYVIDDEVKEIAAALDGVTEAWFRERFARLPAHGYAKGVEDEDFAYAWHWFDAMRAFYRKAAAAGRAVMFTADV